MKNARFDREKHTGSFFPRKSRLRLHHVDQSHSTSRLNRLDGFLIVIGQKMDGEGQDGDESKFFARLTKILRSFGLTPFSGAVAVEFLKSQLRQENGAERFPHVMAYLLNLLNGRSPERSRSQLGCPNVIPGLTSRPIWGQSSSELRRLLPWVSLLEDNVDVIRSEFYALRGTSAFQPYRSPLPPSHSEGLAAVADPESPSLSRQKANESDSLGQLATDSGAWNVAYLHLHGLDFADNLALCPVTASIIAQIPRHYHHAFFSAMAPQTHITPHYGSTNKKIRCHLPLVVPSQEGSSWLRVADQRTTLVAGQCLVFDDSHEHEASNDSPDEPRVVLVVDVWHPDLSDQEVKFLSFLNKGQMAAAHRLAKESAAADQQGKKDFLSVILQARLGAVQDSAVWGHRVVDD